MLTGQPFSGKMPSVAGIGLRLHGLIGAALIAFAEISVVLDLRPFTTWVTPVAWTGYILLIDALVLRLRRGSLITDRPKEFVVMLPLSLAFWLVFEGFNHFIKNWQYINLPPSRLLTAIGMTWSFATIMPAICETTDLLQTLRVFRTTRVRRRKMGSGFLVTLIVLGAVCLLAPLLSPPKYARYMAVPVWGCFIFLLEPINYRLKTQSVLRDWESGKLEKLLSLLLAGSICGVLWEFWNFWAYTKWVYTVPIMGEIKIFEMPIIGWLGFPLLAVELYAMYNLSLIHISEPTRPY